MLGYMSQSTISYESSPVPVREDLPAAHQRFWEVLPKPGSWWTGEERVAIAAEVRASRSCGLCRDRKAALTPGAVSGDHDSAGPLLPAAAIEAVHQIASDPARLSKTWLEGLRSHGLGDEQYVELVGIVVALVSVDSFCRGIGVDLHPLPAPEPGDLTHYRPEAATHETGWVAMIPSGKATGPEDGLFGPGGRTGNVIRAMSLVPDAVRTLLDLSGAHYLSLEQMGDFTRGRGALDRAQIELIAGRVSALRECFY